MHIPNSSPSSMEIHQRQHTESSKSQRFSLYCELQIHVIISWWCQGIEENSYVYLRWTCLHLHPRVNTRVYSSLAQNIIVRCTIVYFPFLSFAAISPKRLYFKFYWGPISFPQLKFHCTGFPPYKLTASKPEIYFYHHRTREISIWVEIQRRLKQKCAMTLLTYKNIDLGGFTKVRC